MGIPKVSFYYIYDLSELVYVGPVKVFGENCVNEQEEVGVWQTSIYGQQETRIQSSLRSSHVRTRFCHWINNIFILFALDFNNHSDKVVQFGASTPAKRAVDAQSTCAATAVTHATKRNTFNIFQNVRTCTDYFPQTQCMMTKVWKVFLCGILT